MKTMTLRNNMCLHKDDDVRKQYVPCMKAIMSDDKMCLDDDDDVR